MLYICGNFLYYLQYFCSVCSLGPLSYIVFRAVYRGYLPKLKWMAVLGCIFNQELWISDETQTDELSVQIMENSNCVSTRHTHLSFRWAVRRSMVHTWSRSRNYEAYTACSLQNYHLLPHQKSSKCNDDFLTKDSLVSSKFFKDHLCLSSQSIVTDILYLSQNIN